MLVKLSNNIDVLKKLKESKCLIVSTVLHVFVVLLFLCPHLFFKSERKFLSNNTQMVVQILIQNNQSISKDKKQDKDSILPKNKNKLDKKTSKKENNQKNDVNNEETIVANQNIANVKYSILKSKEPKYPITAKRLNLTQEVIIKTRLLIDKQGNITEIEFIDSNINKSLEGFFHKEIINSLNTWKFSQVTIDNNPVRIYFYKNFVFKNN